MKVRATAAFAGAITMAVNEERDVPEDVAAPLLKCGYVVKAEKADVKNEAPDAKAEKAEKKATKQES